MRLELKQPDRYELIAKLIDSRDWTKQEMLYHIVDCMDVVFKDMEDEPKWDILQLIMSRYTKDKPDDKPRIIEGT